jgi:hypothetical protein
MRVLLQGADHLFGNAKPEAMGIDDLHHIGGSAMKTASLLFSIAFLLSVALLAQSQPQTDNEPLDLKSYGCAQHLELVDLEDGRSDIVTVWGHGYYNGMRGVDENSGPDGWISVEAFSEQLLKACQRDPEKLFISAVKETAQAKPGSRL